MPNPYRSTVSAGLASVLALSIASCASSQKETAPAAAQPSAAAAGSEEKEAAKPAQVTPIEAKYPRIEADLRGFDDRVAAMRAEFAKIPADPKDIEWVKKKLAHMVEVDQFMRRRAFLGPDYSEAEKKFYREKFHPRWKEIDTGNTADLKKLIAIHSWFTISKFGEKASNDAWLLVQHADLDQPFQEQVLGWMKDLLAKGEVSASNYAYLYDRVASAKKKPQRYGTQGRCVGEEWQPNELEDPARVDELRQKIGLPVMAKYRAFFDCAGHRARADAAYANKEWDTCARLYADFAQKRSGVAAGLALYNAACCAALGGDADGAFASLEKAAATGFRNVAHMEKDGDLKSLHTDPRWQRLIDRLAAEDPATEKH